VTTISVDRDRYDMLDANDRRLREELRRYGIDHQADLDGLLRHIYGNRDLTYAVKDMLVDENRKKVELLKKLLGLDSAHVVEVGGRRMIPEAEVWRVLTVLNLADEKKANRRD
jgi:CRISPR/Cas system-associated endonuclease Cas3-HD